MSYQKPAVWCWSKIRGIILKEMSTTVHPFIWHRYPIQENKSQKITHTNFSLSRKEINCRIGWQHRFVQKSTNWWEIISGAKFDLLLSSHKSSNQQTAKQFSESQPINVLKHARQPFPFLTSHKFPERHVTEDDHRKHLLPQIKKRASTAFSRPKRFQNSLGFTAHVCSLRFMRKLSLSKQYGKNLDLNASDENVAKPLIIFAAANETCFTREWISLFLAFYEKIHFSSECQKSLPLRSTQGTIVPATYLPISRQPLELQSCSNPLKMWKVL